MNGISNRVRKEEIAGGEKEARFKAHVVDPKKILVK